jgi:mono/diheme cytochrome c family protein
VVAVAVPVLAFLFARVPQRGGVILLSAFVAHTAWHWTSERGSALLQYRLEFPAFDAMLLANTMRVAMMLIVIGAAGWLLRGLLGRFAARPTGPSLLLAATMGAGAFAALPRGVDAQSRPATGTTKAPPGATSRTAQKSPTKPAAKLPGRSTLTGVYTAEQATQGKETFTGNCSGCHTPATHTGPAFTLKWAGHTVDELFSYIRNSMPKSSPGSLTEDEYVWVTAYLLKLNGMPAGTTELSGDPALLKGLRIEVPKKKNSK